LKEDKVNLVNDELNQQLICEKLQEVERMFETREIVNFKTNGIVVLPSHYIARVYKTVESSC
jgi:hypothetical protein